MSRFIDVHVHMKGITAAELLEAHRKDQELEASEGVRFLHAWGDPTSGRVFCLSEGPNIEAVQRVHARAGHQADEIYEVPLEAE
ncbi:MAG: SCO4226 family nickel-binding protein [Deltaproteobacteria bacterium]|nr:SCO4226 family nickel-binding protein [Deltaproteobacteria bacterium]